MTTTINEIINAFSKKELDNLIARAKELIKKKVPVARKCPHCSMEFPLDIENNKVRGWSTELFKHLVKKHRYPRDSQDAWAEAGHEPINNNDKSYIFKD